MRRYYDNYYNEGYQEGYRAGRRDFLLEDDSSEDSSKISSGRRIQELRDQERIEDFKRAERIASLLEKPLEDLRLILYSYHRTNNDCFAIWRDYSNGKDLIKEFITNLRKYIKSFR